MNWIHKFNILFSWNDKKINLSLQENTSKIPEFNNKIQLQLYGRLIV